MGRTICICLTILLTLGVEISSKAVEQDESLYSASDAGLSILNGDNFDSSVFNQDSIWLVEFYNHWCGHCIRFAPMFKKFAKDVQGWNFVVKIGTVNCASPKNTELCRTKEINSYPTLKMFKPESTSESMGEDFKAGSDKKEFRKNLVKYILEASDGNDWPEQFPKLQPLESVHEIWSDIPSNQKFAILVFEEVSSDLGVEVILDMSAHEEFIVRRMNKEAVGKYGVTKFPAVFQIHKDGIFQQIAPKATRREEIVAGIKELIVVAGSDGVVQVDRDDSDKLFFEKEQKKQQKQIHGLHMKDLESGLHYSLRQEIALAHTITGESLVALKLYIKVLAKYFPGRKPVVNFLRNLDAWLEETTSDISGDEWVTKIDDLQTRDSYLPERIEWVCCRGSEAKFRGYPCSLWSLFHTLTVNAHNYYRDENQTQLVLLAMRGYMKNFFGCKECSHHFYKMAEKLENEVASYSDAVLWLWTAHNVANLRLHGDASEDPTHPKIQFPSEKVCPDCFDGHNGKGIPIWDENKVLQYLLHYYDKTSLVDDVTVALDTEPSQHSTNQDGRQLDWWELQQRKKDIQKLAEIRQKKREKSKSHFKTANSSNQHSSEGTQLKTSKQNRSSFVTPWGFNQIDVSLCMLLWLVSSGILLLLYFHILNKRKTKRCSLLPF